MPCGNASMTSRFRTSFLYIFLFDRTYAVTQAEAC
jgi:hypothetical protein